MLELFGPFWLTKFSLLLASSGVALIVVVDYIATRIPPIFALGEGAAHVAEAVGAAVGVLGGIYAVAAFLRDKENKLLKGENELLTKERADFRAKWVAAETRATIAEIRYEASRERRAQSDVFSGIVASDVVEGFREEREKRARDEESKQTGSQ